MEPTESQQTKPKIYIPIWKRPPNKFERFEQRPFVDRSGHEATLTVAIYLNKKGKVCEEIARVKWKE